MKLKILIEILYIIILSYILHIVLYILYYYVSYCIRYKENSRFRVISFRINNHPESRLTMKRNTRGETRKKRSKMLSLAIKPNCVIFVVRMSQLRRKQDNRVMVNQLLESSGKKIAREEGT